MDAVEMLKEVGRMSHGCTIDCNECPIGIYNNKISVNCGVLRTQHPDKYVEIVENWSKAHPQKTQADLFFERYPNAEQTSSGFPQLSPCSIGLVSRQQCALEKADCRCCKEKYWLAPVEEN